jgi:hypothetical protein
MVAPLSWRRHPASQPRTEPSDPVSRLRGIRQRAQWRETQSSLGSDDMCDLTPRSSGRVRDKVLFAIAGPRAAQLNR